MTTLASRAHRPAATPADYLELVRQFPLRPLRTKVEHKTAIAQLAGLVGRESLTPGQSDYLEALSYFVEKYEQEHALPTTPAAPLELLQFLMEQNHMTTTDLGYVVGSRGLASEILHGNRGLSKAIIRRLAEHFRVSPALFLEGPAARS